MRPLARELAELSAQEMVDALGAGSAPGVVKRALAWPFFALSRTTGERLADIDEFVARFGLPSAARAALERFQVESTCTGAEIATGPCLILANHPGAYDAFALMAAIDRRDLLIVANDRRFLRALPRLSEHLLFVGPEPIGHVHTLRRALSHLSNGGALLHFPAGAIEPDPGFEAHPTTLLKPWQPGVATLVRVCAQSQGRILVAGVRGVHSPRAKRLLLNRLAEQRGITTLAPLLQIVLRLHDVRPVVTIAEVDGEALARLNKTERIARLRAALVRALSA